MKKLILTLILTLLAPLAQADAPATLQAYLDDLARIEASTAPQSLEPLFARMDDVQAVVMKLDGGQAWLETVPDSDYAALQQRLRGFELSRGYDIYAFPLPDFLLALAEAHGGAADIAFFRLYRQFWTPGYMPVYLRQKENPTPCVRFNEGILPEWYETLLVYRQHYPEHYRAFIVQSIADVEEAIALGVCTCTNAKDVLAEQRSFLKRYPKIPVAKATRARMKQIVDDPDVQPVHCR